MCLQQANTKTEPFLFDCAFMLQPNEYGLTIQNPDPKSNPSPIWIAVHLIFDRRITVIFVWGTNQQSERQQSDLLSGPSQIQSGNPGPHRDRRTLITGFGFWICQSILVRLYLPRAHAHMSGGMKLGSRREHAQPHRVQLAASQ